MTTSVDKIRDDVNTDDRVKIRYNWMSQWNQQLATDNRDPATCNNIDARRPSAKLSGIKKGDLTQREQADKTKREQVTLLEAMGKHTGKMTNKEHEAKMDCDEVRG